MNSINRLPWICPLLAVLVGCATPKTCKAPLEALSAEGITEERKERNEEVVRQFNRGRDFAEFEAAKTRWNQNDVEGCEHALRQIVAGNAGHRDARLLLAEICLTSNRVQEAFEQIQCALDAHPQDALVRYSMGLLLDATGQSSGALAYYEQAAAAAPNNELYAVGYQSALEAAASASTGSASAYPAYYTGVTATDPIVVVIGRGCEALAAGSVETALAYFQEAAATQPDNPQIPISAAVSALRYGQPTLAVAVLSSAQQHFPDTPGVYRVLGAAYYRMGDYQSSQVALQQALSLDKSCALTYFLMGCTLARLGQSESADVHLRQARALDSRYSVR